MKAIHDMIPELGHPMPFGGQMDIKSAMEQSYATALDKGWIDSSRTFGDEIALMHSELSEALEEFRNGQDFKVVYKGKDGKPEGIPIEFADLLIRLFALCQQVGIDLDTALRVKLEFNKTRPYRHGGKKL